MYYATVEHNGETINTCAEIVPFETYYEMSRWLAAHESLDDDEEVVIVEGSFGDCWIKQGFEPEPIHYSPFHPDDVRVLGPGAHPGGSEWWITPTVPVYVARIVDIDH